MHFCLISWKVSKRKGTYSKRKGFFSYLAYLGESHHNKYSKDQYKIQNLSNTFRDMELGNIHPMPNFFKVHDQWHRLHRHITVKINRNVVEQENKLEILDFILSTYLCVLHLSLITSISYFIKLLLKLNRYVPADFTVRSVALRIATNSINS